MSLRTLLLSLALTVLPGSAAVAQEVPLLWDAKERLTPPNMAALPRLRFLTTTDFPPFNFIDGNGRLSGFHVDLARAICAALDMTQRCQIQALPWPELDRALAAGEGEAIIAGISVTAERRKRFAFSRPYLQFPARFVMPRATAVTEPILPKIVDKRIGVIAGSGHERMLRSYFPEVKVVTYAKQEWVFDDLKTGKIDGAFGDGMRAAFWLAGTDAAGCCRFAGGPYLAPEFLGNGLSIATKGDDPALAAAMDYALHQISMKGTFAELYLRYFPVSFF